MGITSSPTQISTLLEIRRSAGGEIPEALISAAYLASASATVMLVLDSVSPSEVDAVLDPVVAGAGRYHRGVVYANARDDAAILNVAAAASRVFAASPAFRAKLASRGIAFEDVSRAESVLAKTA
jgi:hypothetical protein